MPLINLKQMKIDEPTRNFDSSVDENVNISAENNQGLFGAFKFFSGIRSFFKGISALGTLASGSRLPVTDSNGNVTYTTMNDINSYVANNALLNIEKIKNNDTKTNANDCFTTTDGVSFFRLPSNAENTPETGNAVFIQSNTRWTNTTSAYITQFAFVVDTSAGTTEWRNAQHVYTRNGNSLNGAKTFSTWQKLTTESDLKIITISDTTHNFGNAATTSEVFVEFDLSSYKENPCAYIGVLRCGGASNKSYSFTFTLVVSYGTWSFVENSKSYQGGSLTFDPSTSKLRMTLTDKTIGLYEDKLTLLKIQ